MMDLDLTELPEKIRFRPSENVMFKILLDKVPSLWVWIVSFVLGKPPQEIKKQHTAQQIELLPDFSAENKLSILDSLKQFNGIEIRLEMQGEFKPDFKERIVYYWGKITGGALKKGKYYRQVPKIMVIAILNFVLDREYGFLYKEIPNKTTKGSKQADFYGINYIQLPKLQINWENPSQYELIFAFLGAKYWAQVKKILSIYNKLYAGKPGGNLMAELVQTLVSFNVDPKLAKVHQELIEQEKIIDYEVKIKKQKTRYEGKIAKKDAEIAKKDAEITKKDAEITNKDAEITNKDALIARYKAKFGAIPTD